MFAATIGGLGLTGLITKVKIKLQRAASPFLDVDYIKFDNVDEFFEINEANDSKNDFTVSWVDCTSTDSRLGRGIYSGGNFTAEPLKEVTIKDSSPDFPFDYSFINPLTVRLFNILYFNKQIYKKTRQKVHYEPFFYPLDAVGRWNRAYGKDGFLQYQFVVPHTNGKEAVKDILRNVSKSGLSSFLTVLKTFGEVKSPGMLSFPQPGITMAIDFRMTGDFTLKELNKLDDIVRANGGRLYPAKDARMSGEDFRRFYPEWEKFTEFIDPKFSSSFWRRVTK
jgi:FAD/FMN-containing dehydrogenase